MKISVVIPAYNEENYLPRCLKSLFAQEEPADEIIVVDNNSVDATAAIAREYGAIVIKESEQGMIYARNRGFNLVKHDIIARCDADSVLPTQWIKQIKKNFYENEIIGVSGPCYFYDLSGLRELLKKLHSAIFFKCSRIILGHEVMFGSNMALLRAAWLKIREEICTDERFCHEDMDLAGHLRPYGAIKFDPHFMASISARRLKSPASLVDYPWRWIKSLQHCRSLARG